MIPKYLPILKAKSGEFNAVHNTLKTLRKKILPLFEICKMGEKIPKRFNNQPLVCAHLNEIATEIDKICHGTDVLVDAFHWAPDAQTETGEHILPYVYSKLTNLGVRVIPVIGYDRWSSNSYRIALQNLEVESYYCLRLESFAIEDAKDPDFFRENIHNILNDLGIEPDRCAVLLDFEDITKKSIEELISQTDRLMKVLSSMNFKFFALAGCSLPQTINLAVKDTDSTGFVMRKEMLMWKNLRVSYPNENWVFGDYGVRGPTSAVDVIAPHANGKIRYTIDQNYFVSRGHSLQYGNKGAQMHDLAKTIVESRHFMGENFSWGDAQILDCSEGLFRGNSTQWITIDTCHHLAWVVAEVEEFNLSVATRSPKVIS